MANSYFKFKQFTIHQDMAAMKVGTDGVLLGAWANVENNQQVLDVGTGTGLIALMVAQRNALAKVTAIDVDKGAVDQARRNIQLSAWKKRIVVENIAFQALIPEENQLFDHVICNPPFFNQSYKSDNHSRTVARHTDTLSYNDLAISAYNTTHTDGRLSLILPYQSAEVFIECAKKAGWNLEDIMYIRATPQKAYVRALMAFKKADVKEIMSEEMIIEDKGRHQYSDKYIALTKDFYLAM